MQAIDLFDDVEVSITHQNDAEEDITKNISIDISISAESYIQKDLVELDKAPEENLAVIAARKYLNKVDFGKSSRLQIRIHKRIPVAAGLAGGSSNAAATLLGLEYLNRKNNDSDTGKLSLKELIELGVEIGADVPFSLISTAKNDPEIFSIYKDDDMAYLMSSSALCEGIGEKISPFPPANGQVILIKPDITVKTSEIYRLYDEKNDTDKSYDKQPPEQDKNGWGFNVLEPICIKLNPELEGIMDEAGRIAEHAKRVFISGSGPTVVCYYPGRTEASYSEASGTDTDSTPYDSDESGADTDSVSFAINDFNELRKVYKDRPDISAVLISGLLV